MKIEDSLREYGLSEKEIKVYLRLLGLEATNLQEVSKLVDIPRTTVYNTLNYLIEKGLVSKVIKDGVSVYSATDPDKLKDKLKDKLELIESVLPELKDIKKLIATPNSVEAYEGLKGVNTILSDVFKINQEICYFGGHQKSLKALNHIPDRTRRLRMERNIKARVILENFDVKLFHNKKYKEITQIRFSNSLKDFPAMIFIYGDKVAIFSLEGDLSGVIISNRSVAAAMKMIFELYWKNATVAKL